jgi:hypothetical protein
MDVLTLYKFWIFGFALGPKDGPRPEQTRPILFYCTGFKRILTHGLLSILAANLINDSVIPRRRESTARGKADPAIKREKQINPT